MQLRMVARRSLSGSITVVGDIGQATGPWAPASWDEVTAHLPGQRPPRLVELTVSYRTPAEVVEVAARVLAEAAPGLRPPTPGAPDRRRPRFEQVEPGGWPPTGWRRCPPGLSPTSLPAPPPCWPRRRWWPTWPSPSTPPASTAIDPRRDGLGAPLSLLPVDLANGLEFDAVVVVEPAAIVEESPQGLRALYVALTRPTRRLAVVHTRPLPDALRADRDARRTRARRHRPAPIASGRTRVRRRCWRGGVAVN